MQKILFSMSIMLAFICGCSTIQSAPQFTGDKPPSDKALIILERESMISGSVARCDVSDNLALVGKVGVGGKLVWLRDPGPMYLMLMFVNKGWEDIRFLNVEAGQTYHLKLKIDLYGFHWDGPGFRIPPLTEQQSLEDSLVFFRVPNPPGGIRKLKLWNIESKKLISDNLYLTKDVWQMMFLPIGKYNVSKLEVSNGFNELKAYEINADFAVTGPNTAIYIGDINFSKTGTSISKDSDAARAFIEPISKNMNRAYTESLMEINQ